MAGDNRGVRRDAARLAVATRLGRAAAGLSQLTGRGSGTTIGGRVLLAVAPNALRTASAGRQVLAITGTNGKTTTRTMATAAVATLGPVATNTGGANLRSGVGWALARDRRPARVVLEVDELALPAVADETDPRIVVL